MSMDQPHDSFDAHLRGTQIIAGALPLGAVMFIGTVLVLHFNAPQPILDGQGIALFLAVFGAVLFAVHLLVPVILTPQLLRQRQAISADDLHSEPGLMNAYRTILITSFGPLEGAVFANVIAYLLQRHWWSLAIAGAIILWMLAQFPTRIRVERWIEDARRSLS